MAKAEPEKSAPPEEEKVAESDTPLTRDAFEKVWEQFWEEGARTMKQKTIRGNEYQLDVEAQTLHFTVQNTIQQDILQELREPLMKYLRRQLGKPKLQLVEKLEEAATERKPYTNQEKLQVLLEKQPKLKDLVDRLGLDPDL